MVSISLTNQIHLGQLACCAASFHRMQWNKRLLFSVDLRHCILTCPGVRQLSSSSHSRSGDQTWAHCLVQNLKGLNLYIFSQHPVSIEVWAMSLEEPNEAICRPPDHDLGQRTSH